MAFVVRGWVWTPYTVRTDSMAPAVYADEVVGVWRLAQPGLGDVVAYVPEGESLPSFKRVVALGGSVVSTDSDGLLSVDGHTALGDGKVQSHLRAPGCSGEKVELGVEGWGEATSGVRQGGEPISAVSVPEGSLYLLGDNRPAASDSRHVGPISESRILGVAGRVLWSTDSCLEYFRWGRIASPLR
jgi:signal peptidase I